MVVTTTPARPQKAEIQNLPWSDTSPNTTPATSAPALPTAAAKPWHMPRISVGTVSAGSSQVVALGPNWPQKEEK